jgi:surface polysaccharide O-acyltransferase-like enzyme
MSDLTTNSSHSAPHISRDLNVELLRIIACLMVIMIHVRPFPFSGTTLRDTVIFINVINGPAVAAFFLISGFFISKKQTLSHIILRFLNGVILPTAVFVFCLGLIRPWIDTPGMSLLDSILTSQPLTVLSDMLQGFLAFDTVRFGIYADHLWYIFSYASIMFWMPVILTLVKHDESTVLKLMLLIGVFHYTLVNLSALVVLPFGIYLPESMGKPALYSVAGYLFYSWIKKVRATEQPHTKNKRLPILFLLMFIILSTILFFLQKHVYIQGLMMGKSVDELNTDYYFTSWSGLLCSLQTVSLAGFLLLLPLKLQYKNGTSSVNSESADNNSSIDQTKQSSGKKDVSDSAVDKLITTLGGYTFYIYLIHYIFTNHFRATGLEATFKTFFGETSLGLILYSLIYSLFIFVFCSILIYITKELVVKWVGLCKRHAE